MYQHPPHPRPYGSSGLARYGSAPAGSFLSNLVDSILAGEDDLSAATHGMNPFDHGRLFAGENSPCLTSESSCRLADLEAVDRGGSMREEGSSGLEMGRLERPQYGGSDFSVGGLLRNGGGSGGGGGGGGSTLFRHSSSPAGFLSNLMVDHNGYSSATESGVGYGRLRSQLSFSSSRENSLSQFSDNTAPDAGGEITRGLAVDVSLSYAASDLQFAPWDDGSPDDIVFSGSGSGKRVRDDSSGGAIAAGLGSMDPQVNSLEMGTVEKLFRFQQDTAPCRIRAKRGCATHPRSIAERERRTRISEKLKKLQELVPNMDKQTNTSDMLDLAVQHIKSLQGQILKLNEECASCSCKSK